jgi:hypothetical protein
VVCDKEYAEAWAAYDRYKALPFGRILLVHPKLLAEAIAALLEYRAALKRFEDCCRVHGIVITADILGQHNDMLASNIEYLQSLV